MVTLCYLGFLGLSFLGAICDFLVYRIPNFVVGLILIGSFINLGLAHSHADFYLSGLIFIITLLSGYLLYAFKLMGAGDAKFLSASILWIEPNFVVSYLALVTIGGGVLALLFIFMPHQIDYMRLKMILFLQKKYKISETNQDVKGVKGYLHLPFLNVRTSTWMKTLIPYGVAIFIGNLISTCAHITAWGL